MIVEWLMALAVGIAEWFVGLWPEWDVPPEIVNFDQTLNGFLASFDGLGVWAPWSLLGICAGIALTAWVTGITVKTIRAIASYIPFFGGAG